MSLLQSLFVLGAFRMACELRPVSQDRERVYLAASERRLEFGEAADDAPDAPLIVVKRRRLDQITQPLASVFVSEAACFLKKCSMMIVRAPGACLPFH